MDTKTTAETVDTVADYKFGENIGPVYTRIASALTYMGKPVQSESYFGPIKQDEALRSAYTKMVNKSHVQATRAQIKEAYADIKDGAGKIRFQSGEIYDAHPASRNGVTILVGSGNMHLLIEGQAKWLDDEQSKIVGDFASQQVGLTRSAQRAP